MARRKIILWALICLLTAVFVGQTLSQTPGTNPKRDQAYYERLRNMTAAQKQRELERRRRQRQIETRQWHEQRIKEREQTRGQRQIESKKRQEEAIKQALGATDEQWKVIKPRLEKVKNLARESAISISLMTYGSSSGSGRQVVRTQGGSGTSSGGRSGGISSSRSPSQPNNNVRYSSQHGWKWYKPWDSKAPGKLSKGERICEELLKLIEDKNSKPEEIEQKMEALREIRREAGKQLVKARQELLEVITYRQEAALIMMKQL